MVQLSILESAGDEDKLKVLTQRAVSLMTLTTADGMKTLVDLYGAKYHVLHNSVIDLDQDHLVFSSPQ